MSKASVQFVEMVRNAAANLAQPTVRQYCRQCGTECQHRIVEAGQHEIRTCANCGYQTWYSVR